LERYPKERYDWIRYCYPQKSPPAFAAAGFAPNPSDDAYKYTKETLISTRELWDLPCYVLLGEPGTGKSDTFRSDYEAQRQQMASCKNVSVELRSCADLGGEASILQFFGSGSMSSWKASNSDLILYLDGLDEGMLLAETWPFVLSAQLQQLPLERLKLRISCRPAVWPDSLAAQIAELYKLDEVAVYSLAPLSEEHVRTAARIDGLDADKFLNEVTRKAAVSFATKPLTLVFLLRTYKDRGALPISHVELFRENCLRLCSETSTKRLELNRVGLLPEERLNIAKVLGGMSIFCNRPLLAKTSIEAISHKESEILDYRTAAAALPPGTVHTEFKEVLDTGLFAARGEQMLGWAQHTFAEFLASDWTVGVSFTTSDLWQLTTINDGEKERVIPQLITCAAWLCELHKGYRRKVLHNDPMVLLNADESALDMKTRRTLTRSILVAVKSGLPIHELRDNLRKLRHPGIAGQLRPLLRGRKRTQEVRYAAIVIAEACRVQALEEELLRLVMKDGEPLMLRGAGAFAISQFGSGKSRLALKALATSELPQDIDDELKGWSLYALWPQYISAGDVLACLTTPKRENFLGGYGIFIYRFADTLSGSMPVEFLPQALKWAERVSAEGRKLGHISDAIVLHAFENIAVFDIAMALAEFVVNRANSHEEIIANFGPLTKTPRFRDLLRRDQTKRQLLARAVIPVAVQHGVPAHYFFGTGVFTPEDSAVYTHAYAEAAGRGEKRFILDLLSLMPVTDDFSSAVWPAVESGVLPRLLRDKLYIEFGTAAERAQRAQYAQEQQYASKPPQPLVPSAKARIQARLKEVESGQTDSWIWLSCQEMLLGEHQYDMADENSDVTSLPGWLNADDALRTRLVSAAEGYLLAPKAQPLDFVATNTLPWWAIAEYQALRLLRKVNMWSRISDLDDSLAWQRWSIIAVWYGFEKHHESQDELIKSLAVRHDFVLGMRTLCELMNSATSCYGISERIVAGWSSELRDLILEFAAASYLPPACAKTILGLACRRDPGSFIPFLIDRLEKALSNTAEAEIAHWSDVLLEGQPSVFWQTVWPSLGDEARLKLLVSVTTNWNTRVMVDMTDDSVIDTYLLLERHYSYKEDPHHLGGGAHAVGFRDEIAHLRDNALNMMTSRGLVRGIDAAIGQFGYSWLRRNRLEAQRVHRQLTWTPILPSKLLALVAERQKSPTDNPYVQFVLGILCEVVANLILPVDMSVRERTIFGLWIIITALFGINYRRLRQKNALSFWIILAAVLVGGALEFGYFMLFR
jgi:hypothetical protein